MLNDIIGLKDILNLNLLDRTELKYLSIDEQDIIIDIKNYQAERNNY